MRQDIYFRQNSPASAYHKHRIALNIDYNVPSAMLRLLYLAISHSHA